MNKKLFCYAISVLVLAFAMIGCGSKPNDQILSEELEKLFPGTVKISSINLERTKRENDISTYRVSGNLTTSHNLYEKIVEISGKIVIAPAEQKGKNIPFTATLEASGSEKSKWQLQYSNLKFDQNELKGNLTEEIVSKNPDGYLKTDTPDFESIIKGMEEDLSKKRAENEFKEKDNGVDFGKLREETQKTMRSLHEERIKAQNEARKEYQKLRTQYSKESPHRKMRATLDKEFETVGKSLNEEEKRLIDPLLQKRSDAVANKQNTIKLDDGTELTIEQIDAKIKEARDGIQAKQNQLKEKISAQRKEMREEDRSKQDELRQEYDKKNLAIAQQYEEKLKEARAAFDAHEQARRESAKIERDYRRFQQAVAELKSKGYL
ncbi:MAG: DUF1202 family protein [Burkholderiales bacterium]|nr:DUF1202 family protein [Burkholderiales bacterium]